MIMKICILGATVLVGRETIDLANRAWPGAELMLFASRDQELKHGGKTYPVRAAASLESSDAPRGELGFVALDDEHSVTCRVWSNLAIASSTRATLFAPIPKCLWSQ